jgi:hypothetical protein
LYLPFPKKTPDKEIMRTSSKNANNFLEPNILIS